jgi:hypothetical protein
MSRYDIFFQRETLARGQSAIDGGELSQDANATQPREIEMLVDTAQLVKSLIESIGKELPYGAGLAISVGAFIVDFGNLYEAYKEHTITSELILKLAADTAAMTAEGSMLFFDFPELEVALSMLALALSAAALTMNISVDMTTHVESSMLDDAQDLHFQALAAQGRALAQSASSAQFQPMLNMAN